MAEYIQNLEYLMKAHRSEYVKVHQVFDAFDRVEYVYTAHISIAHGEPCVCTRYSYIGATPKVQYYKEYEATWDSAWELF